MIFLENSLDGEMLDVKGRRNAANAPLSSAIAALPQSTYAFGIIEKAAEAETT
ncbi:hypothetical protein [Roseibium marinum]|uniref:hypothetical protein n=1 Tax=Roseibium marinum TaxID=281252 RepID=UPI001472E351|nr:hypothetical protein [Roseibium marinum]